MKSLQKFYFPVVAIAAFLLLAMAQDTQNHITRLHAELDGQFRMVVEWEFANPDAVDLSSLILERGITSNGSRLREISDCIENLGSGQYRCEDGDLYKGSSSETTNTESVFYRVTVNLKNGGTISKDTDIAEYTTNARRRTWGSIKSMFQ